MLGTFRLLFMFLLGISNLLFAGNEIGEQGVKSNKIVNNQDTSFPVIKKD